MVLFHNATLQQLTNKRCHVFVIKSFQNLFIVPSRYFALSIIADQFRLEGGSPVISNKININCFTISLLLIKELNLSPLLPGAIFFDTLCVSSRVVCHNQQLDQEFNRSCTKVQRDVLMVLGYPPPVSIAYQPKGIEKKKGL